MAYIPFEKMKSLRESAKNGDERAKKILKMQMMNEDFSSLLDEYFKQPEPEQPVQTQNAISDEKLAKFLEYNDVKPGDPDYDSTVEAYYKEFPKAKPLEMKATETDVDVALPKEDDSDNNYSIYGDEDEKIDEDDTVIDSSTQHYVENEETEEDDVFDKLIQDEIDAIRAYNDAILEIMNCDKCSDTEKKGIVAKLEEIKRDEEEHWEELKHLKENINKKEPEQQNL